PYEDKDVVRILDRLASVIRNRGQLHVGGFLHAIEKYMTDHTTILGIQHGLGLVRDALYENANYYGADGRKQVAQIARLLTGPREDVFSLDRRDNWGSLAVDALHELDNETRPRWVAVLTYAATASGSKPSGAWLKGARAPISSLGEAAFADLTV